MKKSCQCGNFELNWDTTQTPLIARQCSCDYCVSSKAEFMSDPNSTVTYFFKDESQHKMIKHGHGTAVFHECKQCGVVIVTSNIDNHTYCVINAKTLQLKGYQLDIKLKHYDEETVDERLARRKENWCKVL